MCTALPVRPTIPLVARISDQNASGAPPMAVRARSRLDKFKLLLASPSTDLGEQRSLTGSARFLLQVLRLLSCCVTPESPDADLQMFPV